MSAAGQPPRSGLDMSALIDRATGILARETARPPAGGAGNRPAVGAPSAVPLVGALGRQTCPVVGASLPGPAVGRDQLRTQAHELVSSLFAVLGQQAPGESFGGLSAGQTPSMMAAQVPSRDAGVPDLRRRAHELVEGLLAVFQGGPGEVKRRGIEEQGPEANTVVPVIECAAPVGPGGDALARLTISNEEPTSCRVSLYSSNFISDSGFEIPALRLSVSPRAATIEPNQELPFDIRLSIPAQAPAGTYSALIQAAGSKYVKAIIVASVI